MTTASRSDSPAIQAQSLADVCTLSPERQISRLEMIRREILPEVRSQHLLENGISWSFDATPALRAKLERLAEPERECCASLQIDVDEDPETGALRFRMLGADPRSGLFDPLRVDLTNERAGAGGTLKRLLKSAGSGVIGSVFLFCVVPIGITTLVGASLAAPLLMLDNPWAIAGGAVAIGFGIWMFETRRARRRRTAAAEAGGCGC